MEDEDWPLSFLRVLAILVQAEEISFMYQSIFRPGVGRIQFSEVFGKVQYLL